MTTLRQAIKEELREGPFSALELSRRLSLPEKEVLDHLSHIARNPGQDYRLVVTPAVCQHCGFTFKKRERLTTPTRCPICKHQSMRRPRFKLVRGK